MLPDSIFQPEIHHFDPRMIQMHNQNDIMEDKAIREARKVLSVFRQIEQEENFEFEKQKSKKIGNLESLKKQMRLENLKYSFVQKLNKNNIFEQPQAEYLIHQKEKDQRRWLLWKGYQIRYQKYVLSIFYLVEALFLILVYVLSSLMCCMQQFVEREKYRSFVALGIVFISMILCLVKIVYFSVLKKYHQGIYLEYVSDIFLNYATTWVFYVDVMYLLLSGFLFSEMMRASERSTIERLSAYLFVCTLLKMFVSRDNLTFFRTTFITGHNMDQIYKLIKLSVFNWILAHFVAAMLLAMCFLDQNENWLVSKKIDHQDWYVQYDWAFYWSATIMTTVGFGDYSAVTHTEANFVAYLEIFSCIVLAYNISQIGNIIYAMRLADQQYLGKVAAFKRLAEQNKTSPELTNKIQSYLREEKEIKEMFEYHQQNQVIASLPESLKRDFVMQTSNRIFRGLPFFKSLHKYTLMELGEAFLSKIEYPGDVLVRANYQTQNIMILREGKVGLMYKKLRSTLNGIMVQEIQAHKNHFVSIFQNDRDVFPVLLTGQFLAPGRLINHDVTVMEYSYVSRIRIEKFMEIIKSNQIDMEYFFSIAHSHQAYQREWFQIKCERCSIIKQNQQSCRLDLKKIQKHFYHNKFQCPKLHYFPWAKVVILKHIRTPSLFQEGNPIYRRLRQNTDNCLILRQRIFNKYESKRFINQKKRYEEIVKKSQSNIQNYSKRLRSRKLSGFGILKKTTIDNQTDSFIKRNAISSKLIQEKNTQKQQPATNFGDTLTNEKYSVGFYEDVFENQEMKSIIEDAIKTTVQQVGPKNIAWNFWNLEIDIMCNYRNYFPQSNSAILDNFSLCGFQKLKKKKALTVLGQIIKNLRCEPSNLSQEIEHSDLLGLHSSQRDKALSFELIKQKKFQTKFQSFQFCGQRSKQNKSHELFLNSNLSNIRFEINSDSFKPENSQAKKNGFASEIVPQNIQSKN